MYLNGNQKESMQIVVTSLRMNEAIKTRSSQIICNSSEKNLFKKGKKRKVSD